MTFPNGFEGSEDMLSSLRAVSALSAFSGIRPTIPMFFNRSPTILRSPPSPGASRRLPLFSVGGTNSQSTACSSGLRPEHTVHGSTFNLLQSIQLARFKAVLSWLNAFKSSAFNETVGERVGDRDGDLEGDLVGLLVEGDLVGAFDGLLVVGDKVGDVDGLLVVGDVDGVLEGVCEGDLEGVFDGV